ncbi:hypothetical protein [Oceanibaculum nanhaiense]|uniref:hypothetical protein n=1 Tax=Oceanibaculum nanhaiense TaxID=1909734 RepID=UPI003D27A412
MARAAELGHAAIGIADSNTLAGVVRMHAAAKEQRHPPGSRRAAGVPRCTPACSASRRTVRPMAGSPAC